MPRRPLTPPINVARAHEMRFEPTWTEYLLWQAIRGKRLGVAFRRQVPIGRYIVDFLASQARLVVEVDGGYHARRRAADARRDAWLQRQGYRVLRLDGELVRTDLNAAVKRVRRTLEASG
jgi:very-short-patch-repair endonuclease